MDSVEYVLKIVLLEHINELPSNLKVIIISRFQSFVNFHLGSLMFSILYVMDNECCFGDVLQIQFVNSDESVKYIFNYFVDDRELSISNSLKCAVPNISHQRIEISKIEDGVDSNNRLYPIEM